MANESSVNKADVKTYNKKTGSSEKLSDLPRENCPTISKVEIGNTLAWPPPNTQFILQAASGS